MNIAKFEKLLYEDCKRVAEEGNPLIPLKSPGFNYYCPMAISELSINLNREEMTGFTRGYDGRPNSGYGEGDEKYYQLGLKFRNIALTTGFV